MKDKLPELMVAYKQSRIDAENKKKPEDRNKDIENTLFYWSSEVLALELKRSVDDVEVKEVLTSLVNDGKLKQHKELTKIFFL